jgi:hypothetical protein
MTNDTKRRQAYTLFTALGYCVLLLTFFEIAVGQETFLLLLFLVLGYFGVILILGLCTLALVAVAFAFQCKGDRVLYALGVITIPYVVFAANNVLYFLDRLVVANDTVEVISIAYSISCIVAGERWFKSVRWIRHR